MISFVVLLAALAVVIGVFAYLFDLGGNRDNHR